METKIQKWGNSLAVRLPKIIMDKVGLHENDAMSVEVEDGKVVLLPRKKREYQLQELLTGVTANNLHESICADESVGIEIL